MKGPGTIFETEFASVVALPRVPRQGRTRFVPFPVRVLGRVRRLLLFLSAEFRERERRERISMVIEDGTIDPPLHSLLQRDSRSVTLDQVYSMFILLRGFNVVETL